MQNPDNTINKLDRNTRIAYGVKIFSSQHKDIRRIKRQQDSPSIHGNKFWGASYLLMDYLQNHPPEKGMRILELGCGWGLAGIHCAKMYDAKVTGLDADDAVFPYMQLHANYNAVEITQWPQHFDKVSREQLASFDMVIASDICFWDELADSVYNLIARACEAGVAKVLISDPERPPFFSMAERAMNEYYGELLPWTVDTPRRASGCILLIENA